MGIRELSPELAVIARQQLGEDPERLQQDLQSLKDWLAKQPHLRARTDDQWLVAFLRGCKFSLERSKEKLDSYYTMKSASPELLGGMDPRAATTLEILKLGVCLPIPGAVLPGRPRVVLLRPGAYDATKLSVVDTMRVSHMFSELQMLEDDVSVVLGQQYVIDLSNVTLAHFTQMTPTNIKKMVAIGQDSLPIRQKGSHHIHTPPGVETVINFFKMFMNEKNRSRLYVHNEDPDALFEHVPRAMLPKEYGGEAGTIPEIIEYWLQKMDGHRDWFLENDQFGSDESKRPGEPRSAESMFGTEGSFRQLNLD